MTVEELIRILGSINDKKEVIVECGFNNYDIVELKQTKNKVILGIKLVQKRDDDE
jgi:hypothetical protein